MCSRRTHARYHEAGLLLSKVPGFCFGLGLDLHDLCLDWLHTTRPCLTNACDLDLHARNENVRTTALSCFDAAMSAPQLTAGDLLSTRLALFAVVSNLDCVVFQIVDYHRRPDQQQR